MGVFEGEQISSILGWISIACWIVVYSPQIYENFDLQSGEGLSVLFVIVWFLGDLFNLVGAVLGGLLPTVIILALYYSICDIILLCQIYYYRWKRGLSGHPCAHHEYEDEERAPLLTGDHRHVAEPLPTKVVIARYGGALIFVVAVGIAAWWLNNRVHESSVKETGWIVQLFGWSSAVLYLGARIPQILKNFKTRCEGLSPALFFFAIFGNTAFSLSIYTKSTDSGWLLTNAGWLAGSATTIFLDLFVLCQFYYYHTHAGTIAGDAL